MNFEDEYLDVLQNIEFAIVSVYHKYRQLVDYDVEVVLNALVQEYQAEQRHRQPAPKRFSDLQQELHNAVRAMCEFRLGREPLIAESGQEVLANASDLSVEEIVACLKRIRKSVQRWNRQGGRQGYLNFVQEYVQ